MARGRCMIIPPHVASLRARPLAGGRRDHLLWALAAASVVFWGLRLAAPSEAWRRPRCRPPRPAPPDAAAVARLLGASAPRAVAPPELASRFKLLGVVTDKTGRGAALMAVDGKPPRPFRVGAEVADGYVLRSLDRRAASIGASAQGPAALTLELPVLPLAPNPMRAPS